MKSTCASCRFWVQRHADRPIGECRAQPPTIVDAAIPEMVIGYPVSSRDIHHATWWPVTSAAEWCAVHQTRREGEQ